MTNLIGRDGLIVYLEHPEDHMHPHAMRFLHNLLVESAERNQIIVTTHSPYFIEPSNPEGLRRLTYSAEGSKAFQIPAETRDSRPVEQAKIALKLTDDREYVFAGAVIVVEEPTTRWFLYNVAPRIDIDLDGANVSVISVGGDKGFESFWTLLDGLGIPTVSLRDPTWGDTPRQNLYSYEQVNGKTSFEDFMDQAGFERLRNEVKRDVGRSKPRAGAVLGLRIDPDQVPQLFRDVLEKAIDLAS